MCRRPPSRLLVKDPFSSFLAEHFISAYGFKVLATMKHPAAFFLSLQRMGWEFDLTFRKLSSLASMLDDREMAGISHAEPAARAGALWSCLYRCLVTVKERHPGQVLIVRHEDVCTAPEQIVEDVARWAEWDFTSEMKEYIADSTKGTIDIPSGRDAHVLQRKSASLPGLWRSRVNDRDQALLRDFAGPLMTDWYPDM